MKRYCLALDLKEDPDLIERSARRKMEVDEKKLSVKLIFWRCE